MNTDSSTEVTVLLTAWRGGDAAALDRLTAVVHSELHLMAKRYMGKERPGQTLQATALVNEAYLRLVNVKGVDWKHRAQFFAIAAQILRNILVDAARARRSDKRGGNCVKVDVEIAPLITPEPEGFILELDEALSALALIAPRQARVVELRYFGGLNDEEVAAVMESSARTIQRDWRFAKTWLKRELSRRS